MQLVHRLAPLIDGLATIDACVGTEAAAAENMVVGQAEWRRQQRGKLGNMAWDVARHVPEDVRLRMLQYFICGRETCGKAPRQFLFFAVDASRVGLKNTLVGFLASPSNEAVWLPPQAMLGQKQIPFQLFVSFIF